MLDLVIITASRAAFLRERTWAIAFGAIARSVEEDSGRGSQFARLVCKWIGSGIRVGRARLARGAPRPRDERSLAQGVLPLV